jgi:hypothetical protein
MAVKPFSRSQWTMALAPTPVLPEATLVGAQSPAAVYPLLGAQAGEADVSTESPPGNSDPLPPFPVYAGVEGIFAAAQAGAFCCRDGPLRARPAR